MKPPVFICGMCRSGTHWVRRSLGQSAELEELESVWLLQLLDRMVDWQDEIRQWPGSPWADYGRPPFLAHLSCFFRSVLDDLSSGHRFVESTPVWNAVHLDTLIELVPNAYFVLLHRDGRNVVASWERYERAKGKQFSFREACRRWAHGMNVFRKVSRASSARLRIWRYEDLVDDFHGRFAEMVDFVEVAQFFPRPVVVNSAYEQARDPGDFNSRWLSWDEGRKAIFREHAGAALADWGYVDADGW